MWVLDVIAGRSNTTFYLVAGEWSLGRKNCHFNFPEDSSISRMHALIRVGALTSEQLEDPSTRPDLKLVDESSRFGSFVNEEQCFESRQLHHGDQISFGAKKTVLRVRYQVFVLVASRIQRVNRAQVNDTCQRIGMHLTGVETKDATHCVMDPGHIVATVKVLWALVYNQPVVCTPWIYAILNRSSLSEPLPRCEEFLPSDPSIPSVENTYLPNPLRQTLYLEYAVVFLTRESIEALIPAMGGIAVAAYKEFEEDDQLLCKLKSLISSKRLLLVEPSKGTRLCIAPGQSEQQASTTNDPSCSVEMIVGRRVELLKSMGAIFTSIQELAASVIFVKAPTALNESAFSKVVATYAGSSVQVMSSPDHISLQSTLTVKHGNEEIKLKNDEKEADVTIKEDSKQRAGPHDDTAKVRDDDFEDPDINTMRVPVMGAQRRVSAWSSTNEYEMTPEKLDVVGLSEWRSSRLLSHNVKSDLQDNKCSKPVVVSCELIVKKRESLCRDKARGHGLVNYKRFKNGNGYASRASTASLFPQQTIVSVIDNADRVAFHLDAMAEQERIAEELFAMGEGRTKTKLF